MSPGWKKTSIIQTILLQQKRKRCRQVEARPLWTSNILFSVVSLLSDWLEIIVSLALYLQIMVNSAILGRPKHLVLQASLMTSEISFLWAHTERKLVSAVLCTHSTLGTLFFISHDPLRQRSEQYFSSTCFRNAISMGPCTNFRCYTHKIYQDPVAYVLRIFRFFFSMLWALSFKHPKPSMWFIKTMLCKFLWKLM